MGKKKGKKQDENWGDSPNVETITTGAVVAGPQKQTGGAVGGGKKGKKKKDIDEDDIEADLLAIASEQDIKQEPTETPPIDHAPFETDTISKGKKGKKSRKQDDWEEDVLQELEQLSLNETTQGDSSKEMVQGDSSKEPDLKLDASGGSKKSKKGKKGKQDEEEVEKLLREIEGKELPSVSKPDVIEATPLDDEEEVHVKSKAEKKAAKKEREKKQKEQIKKQQQQTKLTDDKLSTDSTVNPSEATNDLSKVSIDPPEAIIDPSKATIDPSKTTVDPSKATVDPSKATVDPCEATGDPSEVTVDPSQATVDPSETIGDLEDDNEDEKKKKKKKKKKTDKEDEKKAAKSKKVKSAVQKMKEEIEALRLAQKKREEEELLRLKAEEEAERQRQEKIRLEKERKEKKKLKEKERKERLKKEGKLVSKAEKERRLRTELQLQALEQQGIVIPQKTGLTDGEKKRPVRYGSRVRPKKPSVQPDDKSATPTEDNLSQVDEGVASISETTSITEENVKDNWDDEDEEDVKDNWEDESEDDDVISLDDKDKDDDHVIDHVTVTPPKEPDVIDVDVNEGSEESEESQSSDSEDEDDDDGNLSPYEKVAKRIKERRDRHRNDRSSDLLRSPVVCVLGHVDTGKTKILDKIRHTHVQDGEAGGITQQIGATFVPPDAILEQTKMMKEFQKEELKVPGLLIIDTPGHESFSNLRTRGSSMCDIAILVVDIMHGLEPQTIESLNLLRKGNVPFIVALNKIDRLYDWRRNPNSAVRETLKKQKPNTKEEFDERTKEVTLQFAEQGLNAGLFWEKLDFTEYIPMVPTSAITGDGMGDLISLVVSHSEQHLVDQLMFSKEVEAIVLEVKVVAGLGTTIDVILRDGILNEGDTFILIGSEGPFVTQARALLMPQPLRELRVKNAYVNHKTIIASQGVKICGKDLEKTFAGTPVLVAKYQDEIDVLKDESASTMSSALRAFKIAERGVFVQASTLGSLEALVEFLKTSKIPYAGVNIGPVHKKDVMKASVMLERDSQWACILAFDVRVEREAQEMADSIGVRIFTADIIYHLFDNFMKYREELKERKRREHEHIATFPCKVKILPNCVFNARNPIIVGVTVVAGIVKPGTPLVVPSKDFVNIGTISSLEINHKPVDIAHKGSEVCIKIEPTSGEAPKLFGRHFDYDDVLVSKISRDSIDAVKKYFREDLQKSDWQLMIELKKIFQIY